MVILPMFFLKLYDFLLFYYNDLSITEHIPLSTDHNEL